jgi:hypothetical protein
MSRTTRLTAQALGCCASFSCDPLSHEPTPSGFSGLYDLEVETTANTCNFERPTTDVWQVQHNPAMSTLTLRREILDESRLNGKVVADGTFNATGWGGFRSQWTVEGRFSGRSLVAEVQGSFFFYTHPNWTTCSYTLSWLGTRR